MSFLQKHWKSLAAFGFLVGTTALTLRTASALGKVPIGFSAHPLTPISYTDPISRGFRFFRGDLTNPQNILNYPNGPFYPGWISKGMVAAQINEYNQIKAAGVNQICLFGHEAVAYCAYQNRGVTNWTLADLTDTVTRTLQAFPEIHFWEFGNEVNWCYNNVPPLNLLGYWNPTAIIGPQQQAAIPGNYVATLAQFSSQIKGTAGHASDIVIGGGTLSVASVADCSGQYPYGFNTMHSNPDLALQYANAGCGNYMDALGLHLYSEGVYLLSERPRNPTTGYVTQFTCGDIFSYALSAHSGLYPGKPIYITESGCISSYPGSSPTSLYPVELPPPSEARQATYGAQLYSWVNSQTLPVAYLGWYDLVDSQIGLCSPAHYSGRGDIGAYRCQNQSPKPVVDTLLGKIAPAGPLGYKVI